MLPSRFLRRALATVTNGAVRSLRHGKTPAIVMAARNHSTIIAPKAHLNKQILHRYLDLNQKGKVIATYIWIDGTGEGMRCKSKVVDKRPSSANELSEWSYDGSSTYQALGHNSDVSMKPVAIYPDPFLGGDNILVLCDTYDMDDKPMATNNRASAAEALQKVKDQRPMFGFEQEYTMYDFDGQPLGWPKGGYPKPQGPYYCGVGADKIFGRDICDAHFKACLYAGLEIGGTNAEVMPGQWEYQIGPVVGIDCSDQMWISRYMLYRIAEEFGVIVTLDPKPMTGDWNGAGCHANFSTEDTRDKQKGVKTMESYIERLSKRHMEHIQKYDPHGGRDNARRLTGAHEAPKMDKFSWGVGDRGASVRIHQRVMNQGYGYFEDRRPSSNCDPYSVSDILVRTTLLGE